MKINAAGLLLCTFLVGCGGTPPFNADEPVEPTEPTTGGSIDSDRTLPPGTDSPQPSNTIFRKEAVNETGNGFAEGVAYNSADDTFSVDNLPFDGGADTPYVRGAAVSSLGPYAVYEAVQQYPDTQTNATINQFRHRAIYGVSNSGETEFAIVRTGAYVGYGFGGFVYERNGSVVLPTTGQALYNGQGAGLRDYDGRGGLEYTTSDVQIAIDFDDFNETTGRYEGAVDGFVFNRKVYNLAGEDITSDVYGRIAAANDATLNAIPTAVFTVSTNALDANGEITGQLTSRFGNNSGSTVDFENGQYYGIISGDGAEELVGIIVLETNEDPTADNVRETLGFTIYRGTQ